MNKKYVYIKEIHFERNVESGDLEVIVESNHGRFVLYEDVLDIRIIHSVLDYLKEKATTVIQAWLAEQLQSELEKTSEDKAREVLGLDKNS